MRKMLYVLMGVLLISTGVEARSFDRGVNHVPQHANQTIIVNNYQNIQKPTHHFKKARNHFKPAHNQHAKRLHQERVRVCHKKDKTALKVAAVSAGVIGTVALVAALAN